jgi:glycosyltransferase involved in cell wall biosynthesis
MKVLISAYACEPGRGSEPGAGWQWTRAAAMNHDVWVMTRSKYSEPIERALEQEPTLRLTPVYIDLPRPLRLWQRGGRGERVYYLLWQALALWTARRLHRKHHFDVAHHLTFAVDWMPAGVAWVNGLPLVWGPVGGASRTPWGMWRWLGVRGLMWEVVRALTTNAMRQVFGDQVARRANLVVAQNPEVARRFQYARRVVMEPNPAIKVGDAPRAALGDTRKQLHAVFAARLIPWKGLAVAIGALPYAPGWVLDVYGEGPDRERCVRLARRLGVVERVRFHGKCPRAEVLEALRTCDALLHPSIHDSAPWSVAEAVALGCRVYCLESGGPPTICGPFGGVVVRPDRHAAMRLGKALAAASDDQVAPARKPQDAAMRWGVDRLGELLDEWYESAAS